MENYMIALYYCYKRIPVELMENHRKMQVSTCNRLSLNGRIRLSLEGVNGVLSGTIQGLREYEFELRSLLFPPQTDGPSDDNNIQNNSLRYGETLDVKYCHLRHDIPEKEKQLFDSLQVTITKDVVTLIDQAVSHNKEEGENPHPRISFEKYPPSPHLTPEEWNFRLLQFSTPTKVDDLNTFMTQQNSIDNHEAILIDTRNIYESSIGRFHVPGVPTLLTNTRQYSDLTDILEASMNQISGKNVFLYCTGGVRCERVSSYLQALVDSHLWPQNLDKPKNIYQLQGGIQKYLELYGTMEHSLKSATDENSDSSVTVHNGYNNLYRDEVGRCLYVGKNFVFDKRRYDPMVGSHSSQIGKCILCGKLHDDYDNGYAPADKKESRCCSCRILILVCNICRGKVCVWGEVNLTNKPSIYCGKDGKDCVGKGNKLDNVILI